ncbi:MAG TPA: chromate efflux transporter, partial [Gemmatimonadales bacterium]|nr:chromate efflux transporter [Gemmatimonadales bacterium]
GSDAPGDRSSSGGGAAEVLGVFLRLGATAFGGPAAHVALMEEEFVRRRRWLSRTELLDLVASAQLIPGPNSTELAIHLGYRRAGWRGLIAAGIGFILPAVLLTALLAWAYARFGALVGVAGALAGAKAVAFVVVLRALWDFGRSALTTRWRIALSVGALAASLIGADELVILGVAVLLGLATVRRGAGAAAPAGYPLLARLAPALAGAPTLPALLLTFLKFGAVLFGSGYVLLAFLHGDLVDRLHWLTDRQLLDAVAAGQLTPGPVFSTATFVGYLVAGGRGAAIATIGIFLPAFVFVAVSGPIISRWKDAPAFRATLDAVIAASLGLMGAVTVLLGRTGITSWATLALAAAAALALWRWRLNVAWVLVAGVAIGWLMR